MEHFDQTSKSAKYARWLSFMVRTVVVHILKWKRNLTGTHCKCFRIGTKRLKGEALVTTLARQFWTRCNLAIFFSGMLWPLPLFFCLARAKERLLWIWCRSWIWQKHGWWPTCLRYAFFRKSSLNPVISRGKHPLNNVLTSQEIP